MLMATFCTFNRREAFQCLRSTRRRAPDIREEIPDSNMRIDLYTLYLEATGRKINGNCDYLCLQVISVLQHTS